MSWHSLPPEIQFLIFTEISYLDPIAYHIKRSDRPRQTYSWDPIRSYLLVSRTSVLWGSEQRTEIDLSQPTDDANMADSVAQGTWNFSLQRALVRNNSVDALLDCGSESIALQALDYMLEKLGEELSRDGHDKGGDSELPPSSSSLPLADRLGDLLITATIRQFLSCMYVLLENGAKVDVKTPDSRRVLLYVAVKNRSLAAVQLLLRYGAPLEHHTSSSPLALAARSGQFEIMRSLLEAGAQVDDSMYTMDTHPLVLAARSDNIDVVRLLLDNGVGVYMVGIALKLSSDPKIKSLLRERFYWPR
jgi:hypothetical protein